MKPAYFLIICLVAGLALLGTGGTIGYFIGKGKCPDAVQVNELLLEQGRLNAEIAQRDSTVARAVRENEALMNQIANRPSTKTRVRNAEDRLRTALPDSLGDILDRPIADPR